MKAAINTPGGVFEATIKDAFPDQKSIPDAPTAQGFMNADSVTVVLDKDFPVFEGKALLKNWTIKSKHEERVAVVNGSGDSVNVGILLKTTGDIQLHKLFTLVLRYVLKKGRMTLESQGLQIATVTQGAPEEDGSSQDIVFTTSFNIRATAFDFWIDRKVESADKICLHVDGVSYDGSSIVPIYPVEEDE